MSVPEALLAVVRRHSSSLAPGDPVPIDADLRDLGLDSMRAIHLVVDLETTFRIRFPDEWLTRDTFRSPCTLAAAVGELVARGPDA